MPSSSLVEVEVEVEVEVGVNVVFLRFNLGLSLVVVSTFTGGRSGQWLGGWVVGRLEGNA